MVEESTCFQIISLGMLWGMLREEARRGRRREGSKEEGAVRRSMRGKHQGAGRRGEAAEGGEGGSNREQKR